MNQRQGFYNHNQQIRILRPFNGRETNTVAAKIEDQAFALCNQPIFITQNGQINSRYGEPVMPLKTQNTGPVVKLPTDYVAQHVSTSTQFQQQQQQTNPCYQNQLHAQQQQLEQLNYEEYLRQCSQSAMQQLLPVQVPISTENEQMAYVMMHVPIWALNARVPGLLMSSMGRSHQTRTQEVTNICTNGQIQKICAPIQQNDLRDQNIVRIHESAENQQVQEPLNLVMERAQASDLFSSQTIFDKELQQMRSSTVNINIMPGLGNGLIN